jgi:hypothetical protein
MNDPLAVKTTSPLKMAVPLIAFLLIAAAWSAYWFYAKGQAQDRLARFENTHWPSTAATAAGVVIHSESISTVPRQESVQPILKPLPTSSGSSFRRGTRTTSWVQSLVPSQSTATTVSGDTQSGSHTEPQGANSCSFPCWPTTSPSLCLTGQADHRSLKRISSYPPAARQTRQRDPDLGNSIATGTRRLCGSTVSSWMAAHHADQSLKR